MIWQQFYKILDVFGIDDRAVGALPPELEGRSPLEIAQYYQQQLRDQATRLTPPNAPPPPPPPVTSDDFTANPLDAAQRLLAQSGVTRTEYERMSSAAQSTLVATAKFMAKEGKEYWTRLLPQLEQIARGADPLDTIRAEWWETTYNYLVGQNLQTLRSEDAERARIAASNEGVSRGATPPATPRELTPQELRTAEGLGLSPDAWRKGEERLADGRLPVTLDNRRIA